MSPLSPGSGSHVPPFPPVDPRGSSAAWRSSASDRRRRRHPSAPAGAPTASRRQQRSRIWGRPPWLRPFHTVTLPSIRVYRYEGMHQIDSGCGFACAEARLAGTEPPNSTGADEMDEIEAGVQVESREEG
ncbi:hypothetical protein EYF80_012770 [Liparis tanakae]|uniref:Uncharacterized protein n=1 Tax=Liparis tanakae TaxID=230148 RepID=A0A4Z2IHI8_9TELE|nr:hypothetical protein EYF80_012770 [Liparis tanakae]